MLLVMVSYWLARLFARRILAITGRMGLKVQRDSIKSDAIDPSVTLESSTWLQPDCESSDTDYLVD